MEFLEAALKKLEDAGKITGSRESVMAKPVAAALREFCRQNGEFAQAVAHGGSLEDCMHAVAKGVGGSISDLEAYRRAVKFYFRGADVRFAMTIDVENAWREGAEDEADEDLRGDQNEDEDEGDEEDDSEAGGGIVLDLSSFL